MNELYNFILTENRLLLYKAINYSTVRVHTRKARDKRLYWQMIINECLKCESDELKGYRCGHEVKFPLLIIITSQTSTEITTL